MAGRVQGKVALITGGASGLGASAARLLASEGAAICLTDVQEDAGLAVAASITEAGGRAFFRRHDVTSETEWQDTVAAAKAKYGKVDVLVNNAGIGETGPLLEMTLDQWRRMIAINLDGVFLGMRWTVPAMIEAGGGSVINLASILGKVGMAGAAHYCASKGGVTLLSKATALELAPMNIRVNSVHPGFIDTPMVSKSVREAPGGNELITQIAAKHALNRLGEAIDIAEAVLFLASDASKFVTGSEMVIDGGYTCQ